jgi:hypothetical protein
MAYLDVAEHGVRPATSTDRALDRGTCGLERPDRFWDCGTHAVVLEVDEHQHSDRACECEVARMANIHQSLGGLPVVFVRYNPDAFVSKTCKHRNPILRERLDVLARWLRHLTETPSALRGSLSALYLFFDGYGDVPCAVQNIGAGIGIEI